MKRLSRGMAAFGVILASFAAGTGFLAAIFGRLDWLAAVAIISISMTQIMVWSKPSSENLIPFLQSMRKDMQALRGRLVALEDKFSPEPPSPDAENKRETAMDLFLEPVIAMAPDQMNHYRASLAMRMADGGRVDMSLMKQGAEAAGMGPMLEFLTLKRALEVARLMRERGREACVFCRVSAASFASADFISRASAQMQQQPEDAGLIIFEIAEAGLADLTDEGMNGLAQLTELGSRFCLAEARGRGAGPAILLGLGIQYVSLDTALLLSGEAATYIDDCRRAGLMIIGAQVQTAEAAEAIHSVVDYAYGPHFAEPRMVRADLKAA